MFLAAWAVALLLAAPAAAARPPDPLVGLLGIPSKPDGIHFYYLRTRFGHKFICRIWAYGSRTNVKSYIEQCVTPTRSTPKPAGPPS